MKKSIIFVLLLALCVQGGQNFSRKHSNLLRMGNRQLADDGEDNPWGEHSIISTTWTPGNGLDCVCNTD